MTDSMTLILGLGFILGLKHATEADHLAAVSTIVSEERSIRSSAAVGALWGLGHTISLVAAGLVVIVLGVEIPERLAKLMELVVAAMIVVLGARLVYATLSGSTIHMHSHTHGGKHHRHIHFHDQIGAHAATISHQGPHSGLSGFKPLLIGIIHGLAGSAALILLVLTEVMRKGETLLGLTYLLVFGAGSICGMLTMSCLIGLPFTFGARFLNCVLPPLRLFAGVASAIFGFIYGWDILLTL